MTRIPGWLIAAGFSLVLAANAMQAHGQGLNHMAANAAAAAPSLSSPGGPSTAGGRSNPALEFYGGARFAAYQQPVRSVTPPPPLPVQTAAVMKPFSFASRGPSVTPYLALDQRESDFGLPNYYLYVRPQLDQQAVNQVQQAQYRRLQQQVRQANAGAIVPAGTSGGIPTTGHSTQFMNNGGYYPMVR